MEKFWDLNIFFEDLGEDEHGVNQWANIITINPVVYVVDGDRRDHIYTDTIIKATFAESRYIRSLRTVAEYGDDWFESLELFLALPAPPRIKQLLTELPDPNTFGN